jgi:hypothetical protein
VVVKMVDTQSVESLLRPAKLWSRSEVLSTDSVPRFPGVYAWWFREVPAGVPTEGCIVRDELTLLYVGIAPKAPPTNGRLPSRQTLRSRLGYHCEGTPKARHCGSPWDAS